MKKQRHKKTKSPTTHKEQKIKQLVTKGFETTVDYGINLCIDPRKICSVEKLEIPKQ